MAKYKFCAKGKVLNVQKSKGNGSVRNVFHDFDRIVYADSWQDVKEMVEEQTKSKYGRDTRYYEVISCDVLSLDVFKLEYEGYNWDAHRRAELEVNE